MATGSATRNVLPTPGALRSVISPAMPSTSARVIVRPRPVPPYLRVVVTSACSKLLNRRCCASCEMPMPVSSTSISSSSRPVSVEPQATRSSTVPTSVNLSALPIRLSRIWRSRIGSPRSHCGTFGSTSLSSERPSSCARRSSSSTSECTISRRSKSTDSKPILPASIFEKSRMSLMMASSASALPSASETRERDGAGIGSRSPSCSMPMMPDSGVRSSWLIVARNSDFARVASSALSRARRSASSWRLCARASRMNAVAAQPRSLR